MGAERWGARRIVVAGASGAGKTTLARRIAEATALPHTEIDALHWRAGWTANAAFVDEVAELVDGDGWVTEYQYPQALALLTRRAQLLVWRRPPRLVVLARVIRRTVRRRLRRELLWGVNVEPPFGTILTDRDHIVRWSWRSHRATEDRVRAAVAAGLPVVQVRGRADERRLLALLAAGRALIPRS